MLKNLKVIILSALLLVTIAGCSGQEAQNDSSSQAGSSSAQSSSISGSVSKPVSSQATSGETQAPQNEPDEGESAVPEESSSADVDDGANTSTTETDATATEGELTVHFGDDGAPFTMHLYDNSTAAAIASYVGTADWRLPIYNYDGYDNWEVMQYYDLPSRYEIPSNPQTVTTEKSGEVFYSEPNRIVLFYGDGEVTGEYSRVGYFDATEEFVSAVQSNPVLEGWGNKIVLIKD